VVGTPRPCFAVSSVDELTNSTKIRNKPLGQSEPNHHVLRLVSGGNANKEIAAQLSITEETVKGHIKNILAKLGANDRTHAVTIGLKRGIIDL
jgi:DNA-binding NarL/FixJ family response regulator